MPSAAIERAGLDFVVLSGLHPDVGFRHFCGRAEMVEATLGSDEQGLSADPLGLLEREPA